jgi:hypothetical protein
LSKGTIAFVELERLEIVYARFSIHKEDVIQVYEFKEGNKYISICS